MAGRPDDDMASRGAGHAEVVGVRCPESSCATEAPRSSQTYGVEGVSDETCRRRKPYWHRLGPGAFFSMSEAMSVVLP